MISSKFYSRHTDTLDDENAGQTAGDMQSEEKDQKTNEVDEKLQKERDAEVKRLTMGLEDRMAEFRNLLLEKSVRFMYLPFHIFLYASSFRHSFYNLF